MFGTPVKRFPKWIGDDVQRRWDWAVRTSRRFDGQRFSRKVRERVFHDLGDFKQSHRPAKTKIEDPVARGTNQQLRDDSADISHPDEVAIRQSVGSQSN